MIIAIIIPFVIVASIYGIITMRRKLLWAFMAGMLIAIFQNHLG